MTTIAVDEYAHNELLEAQVKLKRLGVRRQLQEIASQAILFGLDQAVESMTPQRMLRNDASLK